MSPGRQERTMSGGMAAVVKMSDVPVPVVTDLLASRPGRVIGLEGSAGSGLTRVGFSMLAGTPNPYRVVVVDVRGWLCPLAAWEVGIDPGRLAVVRCGDPARWTRAVAALLDGVKAVYAEVPRGIRDVVLRRLGAKARAREVTVILRPVEGRLPSGLAYLRVRADQVVWAGAGRGHGRLGCRTLVLELSGKGAAGRRMVVEVEDDGAHPVRVVSRLVASQTGRAAG